MVLIVLIAFIKGSGKDEGVKVAVDKVAKRDIIEVVSASGKIFPEVEVKVSSDISGEITDLMVEEGDSVVKGQVLARIYADIYGSARDRAAASVSQSQAELANSDAALSAFKARLDQSKAAFDRNSELLKQKVISVLNSKQQRPPIKPPSLITTPPFSASTARSSPFPARRPTLPKPTRTWKRPPFFHPWAAPFPAFR